VRGRRNPCREQRESDKEEDDENALAWPLHSPPSLVSFLPNVYGRAICRRSSTSSASTLVSVAMISFLSTPRSVLTNLPLSRERRQASCSIREMTPDQPPVPVVEDAA
jgi:hypothetical protein